MKNRQADILPPKGNYHELRSYRKAMVIYDLTYRFCERFLAKTDRTVDEDGAGGPLRQAEHH